MAHQPNILFFVADQLRFDCTGYAGIHPVKTPNIDRVAAEGAAFYNAYTPTPVCAPARQAFLSGRRAESFGALWNYNFIKTGTVMPDDDHFLRHLNEQGYGCELVGAWDGSTEPASAFGIDNTQSLKAYGAYLREKYPDVAYHNSWFGEHNPIPAADSRSFWCADRAIEAAERISADGKPFFVWVDCTDPHLPCRPSSPYYEMYDPQTVPVWDGFGDTFENKPYIQKQQVYNWRLENRGWEEWAETVACYYGAISQLDAAFGRIVDALEKSGQLDDTLIVFTSDHGDMCGSHGMIDKHYILYDDVVRVPLALRLPGAVKAGLKIYDYVYNCLDFSATLAELLGFSMPQGQGTSLLPLCRGEAQPRDPYAVFASNGQQFGLFTQRGIRTDEWKYVWNPTDIDELYDLKTDPGEKHNRIAEPQYRELVGELRRTMRKELIRCGDPFAKTGWLVRQLEENDKLLR